MGEKLEKLVRLENDWKQAIKDIKDARDSMSFESVIAEFDRELSKITLNKYVFVTRPYEKRGYIDPYASEGVTRLEEIKGAIDYISNFVIDGNAFDQKDAKRGLVEEKLRDELGFEPFTDENPAYIQVYNEDKANNLLQNVLFLDRIEFDENRVVFPGLSDSAMGLFNHYNQQYSKYMQANDEEVGLYDTLAGDTQGIQKIKEVVSGFLSNIVNEVEAITPPPGKIDRLR